MQHDPSASPSRQRPARQALKLATASSDLWHTAPWQTAYGSGTQNALNNMMLNMQLLRMGARTPGGAIRVPRAEELLVLQGSKAGPGGRASPMMRLVVDGAPSHVSRLELARWVWSGAHGVPAFLHVYWPVCVVCLLHT